MLGEIVLADPVGVVDLEDDQLVRLHGLGVAQRKRPGRHRLRRDVAPEIDEGEAPVFDGAFDRAGIEQRLALGQRRAVGVVQGRRAGQVAHPLGRAGQRVVTVDDMGRPLDLLAAGDALLVGLAGGRADIVVERHDGRRAGRRLHDRHAFRIIGPHHRLVIEEIETGMGRRPVEQLEAVGGQGRLLFRRQGARIDDRHLAAFQVDAFEAAVAAVAVAPGQHLAVAVERGFRRRRHVAEGALALGLVQNVGGRFGHGGNP